MSRREARRNACAIAARLIEGYFDDMETPIMTAHDKTFTWGQIGIGSFDDTARYSEVKLWGNVAKPAEP